MKEDPIVAEVRRVREEHAARYNYDLRGIYAVLKKQEKLNPLPKASFPPKRIPMPMEEYETTRTLFHVLREDTDVSYGQDSDPNRVDE